MNEKEMKETIAKISKTKSWFFEKIKKKLIKNTNAWRLNNMLLNNQVITEEIKE